MFLLIYGAGWRRPDSILERIVIPLIYPDSNLSNLAVSTSPSIHSILASKGLGGSQRGASNEPLPLPSGASPRGRCLELQIYSVDEHNAPSFSQLRIHPSGPRSSSAEAPIYLHLEMLLARSPASLSASLARSRTALPSRYTV
jgi:hypothetical protein